MIMPAPASRYASSAGTSAKVSASCSRGGNVPRSRRNPPRTSAATPAVAPPKRQPKVTAASRSRMLGPSPIGTSSRSMPGTSGASDPAATRHLGISASWRKYGAMPGAPARKGMSDPGLFVRGPHRKYAVESGYRQQVQHPLCRRVQLQTAPGGGQPFMDADEDGQAGRVAERDLGKVEHQPPARGDVVGDGAAQLVGGADVELTVTAQGRAGRGVAGQLFDQERGAGGRHHYSNSWRWYSHP